jgi:hypothetical protein
MATSTRQIMEGKCPVLLLIKGMNMKNTPRTREQDPIMEVPGQDRQVSQTAMKDHLVSQQTEFLRDLPNFLKSNLRVEIISVVTLQAAI